MLGTMEWIPIVLVALAVILDFATRNTIASLATVRILVCFLVGQGIFGFTELLKALLGNEDFIWVITVNIMVGIMVAYYEKSGVVENFTSIVDKCNLSRKAIHVVI